MKVSTSTGVATTRGGRRRLRLLAAAALVGTLALGACSGDEPGDDPTGAGPTTGAQPSVDADGDGTPDATETEATTAEPVAPPTAPADIAVQPGKRSVSGDTSITVEGDRAAFVLPSGNLACTVTSANAVCQVSDLGYQVRADHLAAEVMGSCSAADADAAMLSTSGLWTCVSEPVVKAAAVDQGGWWAEEGDGTTTEVDGATVAVLPYGSTITVGPVSCSSAEAGVTCRSSELGRQFTVSRNAYSYGAA